MEAEEVSRLRTLLPLEDENLVAMLRAARETGSAEQAAEYLTGILGESGASLEFVAGFTERHFTGHRSRVAPKPASKPARTPTVSAPAPASASAPAPAPAPASKRAPGKHNKHGTVKLDGVEDIDAVLKQIELASTKPEHRKHCNCGATKHPLNEVTPNCLNCGKIICVLEGMGPCTFCGHVLLDQSHHDMLISSLRNQKARIKQEHHVKQTAKARQASGITSYSGVMGGGAVRYDAEAIERAQQSAVERKNTLIGYDRTAAQRTKIIDQAADFDSGSAPADKWADPATKALQMLRQQRELRKADKKKKKVLSIDVRGRAVVTTTYEAAESDNEDDDRLDAAIREQERAVTASSASDGGGSSSQGEPSHMYTRPVYRPVGALAAGANRPAALASVPGTAAGGWRRVQDDYDFDDA